MPPSYPRTPDIATNPQHPGGSASQYTEYKLKNVQDRKTVREDVLRVAGNGSFVSKTLLIITRRGASKNFVTITGEDGLTFGIKDFISDSVLPLMLAVEAKATGSLTGAFGGHADDVIKKSFLNEMTSSSNDLGLVAIGWFRNGLDMILSDRRFHGVQLAQYVKEAVNPSLQIFTDADFKLEFSLAAMIGVANSFGAGGMSKRLAKAKGAEGEHAGEEAVIRRFVRDYALRDAGNHVKNTEQLLRRGFGDETGLLPSADDLGHSGRRILELFNIFPWKSAESFSELGAFQLDPDEVA